MGLSRRKFTKEVRVAAIQRLDGGRNSVMDPATRFREAGSGVGMKPKSRRWPGRRPRWVENNLRYFRFLNRLCRCSKVEGFRTMADRRRGAGGAHGCARD
jgi:hypothetical protein